MKTLLITGTPEEITGKVKVHQGKNTWETTETEKDDISSHKKSQGDSPGFLCQSKISLLFLL